MVLHHEAHQRQLGRLQLEAQRLFPAWVEACGTESGWARPPRPPATPGMGPARHATTALAPKLGLGLWWLGCHPRVGCGGSEGMGEALGVVCWGILEGMGFMLGCTGWNGITMGAG